MSEWQPIETAPIDRPILATSAIYGQWAIVEANEFAEWECLSFELSPMGVGFYPTHWMPLPPPPASNEPLFRDRRG